MMAKKIFKVLAVFLTTLTACSAYTTCLSCKGIVHARDCNTIERCGPSSACFIDGTVTSLGHFRFNLGCRDVMQCLGNNVTSSKRETESKFCSTCCSGDLCNSNGCREEGYPPSESRGPICFNCPDQQSTDDCQIITTCRTGDVCKLRRILYGQNNEIRYETTCEYKNKCNAEVDFYKVRPEVGRKRSSEEFKIGNTCLVKCCDTDLCNSGCRNTSTSVTTLTPPTSVTSTPVKTPSLELLSSGTDQIFSQLGSTVSLTCVTRSLPAPIITWSFARNGITTVINSNTLTFASLQPSQLGNYTCTAHGNDGSTSKTFTISSNVTGAMDCSFDQPGSCLWTNNPLDDGDWKNSGEQTNTTIGLNLEQALKNLTGNFLYIPNKGVQAERVVDLMSPELGPAGPACLSFLYYIEDHTGDQIQVETMAGCESYTVCSHTLPTTVILHGSSTPTTSWRLAQIRLPAIQHNHNFVIKFIHSVTGTKRNGSSAIDELKYTEGNCQPSMTLSGPRDVTINVDKTTSLRLTCQIHGFPSPVYNWTKQGGCGSFNNIAGNTVLVSSHMSTGDAGTYVCRAVNSEPEATPLFQTFHVNVNGGPDNVCTFEDGTCGWTQDDRAKFNWTTNSGPTPSMNTGPDTDHTLRNKNGTYMYAESSSPRTRGDMAVLRSPRMPGNQSACFSFFYHMWGNETGFIVVSLVDTCTHQQAILFNARGPHDNKWLFQSMDIPAGLVPNEYHIMVSAIIGTSYHGDMAVDDLLIKNGPCS